MQTHTTTNNIIEISRFELENDEKFQYWNKSIGLSFDDFTILELCKETKRFYVHKEGKKDIGNYSIQVSNGEVESFGFDMANEKVRQNTLKKISHLI